MRDKLFVLLAFFLLIRAMGSVGAPTQVETGTNEIKISVTLSYEIR